jgi:hypothetical protein
METSKKSKSKTKKRPTWKPKVGPRLLVERLGERLQEFPAGETRCLFDLGDHHVLTVAFVRMADGTTRLAITGGWRPLTISPRGHTEILVDLGGR